MDVKQDDSSDWWDGMCLKRHSFRVLLFEARKALGRRKVIDATSTLSHKKPGFFGLFFLSHVD